MIDEIFSKLVAPIDVIAVNELVHRLKAEGDLLFRQVEVDLEKMYLADASLLFANRERLNHSDIRVACRQAEGLYAMGDFDAAYQVTANAIRTQHESE